MWLKKFCNLLFQPTPFSHRKESLTFAPTSSAVPPPRPPHSLPRPIQNTTTKAFKDALRLADMIIEERKSLPITSCVYLTSGGLYASNLENFLYVEVPDLYVPRPVCVPMKLLKQVFKGFSDTITFTLEPDLTNDNQTLIMNGQWRFATLPAEEFPMGPFLELKTRRINQVSDPFPVPQDIRAVFPAVSKDTGRVQLCGVCFDQTNGVVAATDGHRLHLLRDLQPGDHKLTIPYVSATVVDALMARGDVTASVYQQKPNPTQVPEDNSTKTPEPSVRYLAFQTAGVDLWVRPIDIEFPDYEQVIPNEKTVAWISLPREALMDALRGAIPFLPKKAPGVLLYSAEPGQGKVWIKHDDTGEYVGTFPAPGWPLGLYVGVNVYYLLQALQAFPRKPKQVPVALRDHQHAMLWEVDAFSVVIMPMRVLINMGLPADLQAVLDHQAINASGISQEISHPEEEREHADRV